MRVLCLAFVFALVLPSAAQSRSTEFSYQLSRVWNATVRLLRVDFESKIVEKDREDGYFLFEYPHLGKIYPGSVEIVEIKKHNRESIRVEIKVPGMPSYVEQMILTKLDRKLRREFGKPMASRPVTALGKKADKAKAEPAEEPADKPEEPTRK